MGTDNINEEKVKWPKVQRMVRGEGKVTQGTTYGCS